MMKSPRNMMATPEFNRDEDMTMPTTQPHIKDIGPHEHAWRTLSADGGLSYQECTACHTRRVLGSNNPVRQDWIDGGPWDPSDNASVKENEKLISENKAENEKKLKAEAQAAEQIKADKLAALQAQIDGEKAASTLAERNAAAKAKVEEDAKSPARELSRKSSGARCRLLHRSERKSRCRRISSTSARGHADDRASRRDGRAAATNAGSEVRGENRRRRGPYRRADMDVWRHGSPPWILGADFDEAADHR